MKKFACLLLLSLTTLLASAQNTGGPLKFLGIPIDGPKEAFVTKLKGKGFVYSARTESYKGQFNGQDVDVYIHTNHNLVDRVYVAFPTVSEQEIKIDFNRLLNQFKKTGKYTDLSFNSEIGEDDDISYEITVNNKRYQASFSYFDPNRDMLSMMTNELPDHLRGVVSDNLIDKFVATLKQLEGMTEEEINAATKDIDYYSVLGDPSAFTQEDAMEAMKFIFAVHNGMQELADGSVWVMIHESYGQYQIGLYYDNLHNRAHGEDL